MSNNQSIRIDLTEEFILKPQKSPDEVKRFEEYESDSTLYDFSLSSLCTTNNPDAALFYLKCVERGLNFSSICDIELNKINLYLSLFLVDPIVFKNPVFNHEPHQRLIERIQAILVLLFFEEKIDYFFSGVDYYILPDNIEFLNALNKSINIYFTFGYHDYKNFKKALFYSKQEENLINGLIQKCSVPNYDKRISLTLRDMFKWCRKVFLLNQKNLKIVSSLLEGEDLYEFFVIVMNRLLIIQDKRGLMNDCIMQICHSNFVRLFSTCLKTGDVKLSNKVFSAICRDYLPVMLDSKHSVNIVIFLTSLLEFAAQDQYFSFYNYKICFEEDPVNNKLYLNQIIKTINRLLGSNMEKPVLNKLLYVYFTVIFSFLKASISKKSIALGDDPDLFNCVLSALLKVSDESHFDSFRIYSFIESLQMETVIYGNEATFASYARIFASAVESSWKREEKERLLYGFNSIFDHVFKLRDHFDISSSFERIIVQNPELQKIFVNQSLVNRLFNMFISCMNTGGRFIYRLIEQIILVASNSKCSALTKTFYNLVIKAVETKDPAAENINRIVNFLLVCPDGFLQSNDVVQRTYNGVVRGGLIQLVDRDDFLRVLVRSKNYTNCVQFMILMSSTISIDQVQTILEIPIKQLDNGTAHFFAAKVLESLMNFRILPGDSDTFIELMNKTIPFISRVLPNLGLELIRFVLNEVANLTCALLINTMSLEIIVDFLMLPQNEAIDELRWDFFDHTKKFFLEEKPAERMGAFDEIALRVFKFNLFIFKLDPVKSLSIFSKDQFQSFFFHKYLSLVRNILDYDPDESHLLGFIQEIKDSLENIADGVFFPA